MPEKFGVAALSAFSFVPAASISSIVVGTAMPDCLEEVLAVEHDARAGVVRHAVELAVVRPGLDAGSAASRRHRGRPCLSVRSIDAHRRPRTPGPGCCRTRRRRGCRCSDSDVVSFSTMPVHCWRSNVTFDVGVDLGELGDRVLDDLVGRVAAVQPEPDGLATARPSGRVGTGGRRRRRVAGGRGAPSGGGRRARCVVVIAAGGDDHAGGGQHGQRPHGSGSVHGRPPRERGWLGRGPALRPDRVRSVRGEECRRASVIGCPAR